ncbi:MAG: SMP-30/gluconolactonase/LRE family protein [Gammaproteobacteria bacterium]|nr:SMP-30/gluconolactonase/LRE family protein [Gammaproteobacteria bacterium]
MKTSRTSLWAGSLALAGALSVQQSAAQEFRAGGPVGTVNEAGEPVALTDNVKVFGSFRFAESCTFDPERNLIIAMNAGIAEDLQPNDGFASLINPDGSVHTVKWIGATRDGLTLQQPLGSAIRNGLLYTVDSGFVRTFDLATGAPRDNFAVEGGTFLNGIAVAADGTVYASNSFEPERIYKVTPNGESSIFVEGPPLAVPNGVAMDQDGNIVVVNIGDNAVLTFDPDGELVRTERAVEGGNDGVVVLEDGTKYVSSVRFGSVSRIRPGQPAEIIAAGIPSAASMCYDSVQHQLVIPMNDNNALAFVTLDD